MSGYWLGILAILSINIIFAYSVFVPATTGQLNLGGAGFMAIGAYTGGYLSTGLGYSMWVTVPGAMLATAAISFLIAFPILRTRGVYMVLATFAFAEVVSGIILNTKAVGGSVGYEIADYGSLSVVGPAAILTVGAIIYLMSTRLGLAMRAVHDDENVAAVFGVNVRMTQVAAFTIGGALAGLAGSLYAHHFNYIEIQHFNLLLSIFVLLYVLIGGTQTAYGPLAGALIFTLLPEFMRIGENWRFVFFGVFLVAVMVFRSEGLITRTMLDGLRYRGRTSPVRDTA